MDLHNILRFLRLRMDVHTQEETRIYANAMYELIKPLVPVVIGYFETYTLNSITLSANEVSAISGKPFVGSKSELMEFEAKKKKLGLDKH